MAGSNPDAARGASSAATVLDEVDPRLRRSILRVAFTSAVYFWHPWNAPAEVKDQFTKDLQGSIENSIESELIWLEDLGGEPSWPRFSEEGISPPTRRRGLRIGGGQVSEAPRPKRESSRRFVNHQIAALWLSGLWSKAEVDAMWMKAIEATYAPWTFAANGAGLSEDDEIKDPPTEWNAAFFSVMTTNFRSCSQKEIVASLEPLLALPDEPFFDLMGDVLFKIDALFFNEGAISIDAVVALRTVFADRLAKSYGWKRIQRSTSTGIEMHLGPAVATLFFNEFVWSQSPRCYLPANFVARSLPFVPLLQRQFIAAPCLFVALCLMNWVEAAPTSEHLPLVVAFSAAAVATRPDDKAFWIEHGIGGRICGWLTGRFDADPTSLSAHRSVIDHTLAHLVAVGISEARYLEIKLIGGK